LIDALFERKVDKTGYELVRKKGWEEGEKDGYL